MNLVMFGLWVLVGLLAGWLAGVVMKRGGYGLRGDSILGLAGSLVGGGIWVTASPAAGLAMVALVAFGGAAVLIVLQRKIWPAIA